MNMDSNMLVYFYLTLAIVALAIAIVAHALIKSDRKSGKR